MIVRKNQMDAMRQDMLQDFEDRTFEHLKEFVPGKLKKLGEEGTREQIRAGISRADEYDIVREREVVKFIDLKFVIHQEFDTHPELPWVQAILNDRSLDGEQKIAKIHEELPSRLAELARNSQNPGASGR